MGNADAHFFIGGFPMSWNNRSGSYKKNGGSKRTFLTTEIEPGSMERKATSRDTAMSEPITASLVKRT